MSFWIVCLVLVILTGAFLSMPLWRRKNTDVSRAEYDLEVFKNQLKELERDLERGLITENEAKTARLEVQQRILAADEQRRQIVDMSPKFGKGAPLAFGVIIAVVVGVSGGLYAQLGSLGYADMPYASRDLEKERHFANGGDDMAEEIAKLKDHLAENGDDIDSWMLLGRTYRNVGRMREAVDAMDQAVELSGRHPFVLTEFAETKIYALHGQADEMTERALLETLQKDPAQFKAMFYLGYVRSQFEQFESAMQIWTDLIAISPPDAPWLERVKGQMQETYQVSGLKAQDFTPTKGALVLAKQLKLEWENTASAPPVASASTAQPGPSREDIEAASEMTAQEQDAMIRSMVQRLADRVAENPEDLAGWQRLVQVYQVLGEDEKSRHALEMVQKLQNQ